jgi:hypothetical protein
MVALDRGNVSMRNTWLAVLIGFAGGSVVASLTNYGVSCFRRPVISARLEDSKGCYVTTDVGDPPTHKAKYLRLLIENTGLSSIKDCSGYINQVTKSHEGTTIDSKQEVLMLGWSHSPTPARNIPHGAFFYMDVVALHALPQGNILHVSNLPNTLSGFFDNKAKYELSIVIAADNAKPSFRTASFDYDPKRFELLFSWDPPERDPLRRLLWQYGLSRVNGLRVKWEQAIRDRLSRS